MKNETIKYSTNDRSKMEGKMDSSACQTIKIRNCNCIKSADIEIQSNCLNIKYGINGTGKSTISKAIRAKANNDQAMLDELLPYGSDKNQPDQCPDVLDMPFTRIRVFDETYASKYLFRGDGFFDNSFRVFLQSVECDQLAAETENMLLELQGAFQQSSELEQVRLLLPQLFSSVKFNNGKVVKSGGMGEFLRGNGCGFDKHEELKPYQSYYRQEDFSRVTGWAKWRRDGIEHMNRDICPFCVSEMEISKIDEQNAVIQTAFKNSAISTASAVLEYLKRAVESNCIKEEELLTFERYMGDSSKAAALTTELNQLAVETDYLNTQITIILNFKPMNVSRQQIDNIEQRLREMQIEDGLLGKFYCTEFMKAMVAEINSKIMRLREKAQQLKGLFRKYDDKLGKLIRSRMEDINQFLSIAGFPYEFQLEPDGNEKAKTYLVPTHVSSHAVKNPASHLSWGERNAFSLVMFMFQAVSEDADLIVLDDPISAFDENKKFAIIRRLFDNQKDSFRDKTVLMLTHDTQPLIDYVKVDLFRRHGLTTNVHVMFIESADGIICEREIIADDLKNIMELTRGIAKDSNANDVARIVNLRKYIELTCPDCNNSPAYHILSNIIHGRDIPLYPNNQELEPFAISSGCSVIAMHIGDFSYSTYIDNLSDSKLLHYYRTAEPYEKMLSARLLFERRDLLIKLRREYPALGKFLNESNHIENDYVFQLDPRKYLQIPQCYLRQLNDFISNEIAL